MKRAKVSSVYEGRRKKKSREEKEYSSRRARINARARKHGRRPNVKAVYYFVTTATGRRPMKNSDKSEEQEEAEAMVEPEIDAGEMINAKMEKWELEGPVWWEEWPLCWSYEEQWMWVGIGGENMNAVSEEDYFLVGEIWN